MSLIKRLLAGFLICLLPLSAFAYDPQAKQIKTDTANFDNNLSSADTDVQKALETIDSKTIVSTESDPVVKAINGIVQSNGTTISAVTSGTDIKTINGSSILGSGDIAVSSADEKIKYDATDTASGYLGAKTVAGTGISLSEGTSGDADKLVITNSAPDQTVSLSNGTGISVTGTYPSFTIANTGVTAESDPTYSSWYNSGSPTLTGLTLSSLTAGTSNPKLLPINSSTVITGSAEFTGTGTVGASGTIVTGVGTLFLTEAKIGGKIRTNAGSRTITAVSNNTSLTVDSSFSQSSGRTVYFTPPILTASNSSGTPQFTLGGANSITANYLLYLTSTGEFKSDSNVYRGANGLYVVGSSGLTLGNGVNVPDYYLNGVSPQSGNPIVNMLYLTTANGSSKNYLNIGNSNTKLSVNVGGAERAYFQSSGEGTAGAYFADNFSLAGEGIVNNGGTFDHEAQFKVVANNACSGTASACSTFGSEGTCEAQSGCSWGFQGDSCTGTLVCTDQTGQGQTACEAIGCTWSSSNCSDFNNNYEGCVGQSPCQWECSDCSVWNSDQYECENHNNSQTGCANCSWDGGSASYCDGTVSDTYCNQWDYQPQSTCEANTGCSMSGGDYTDCYPSSYDCATWNGDGTACSNMGCTWHDAVGSSCSGTYTTTNCTGTYNEGCSGSPNTSCGAMYDYCDGSPTVSCGSYTDEGSCNAFNPFCTWSAETCVDMGISCGTQNDNGTLCSAVGCTWHGQICTDYSSHGSDCTYTASGNQCTGTASECTSFTNYATCIAQGGCTFTYGDAIKGDGNVWATNTFKLETITDALAPNNSIFVSSDHSNHLCFKNSSGSVDDLQN